MPNAVNDPEKTTSVAQGRPDAPEQLAQLLDSPEAWVRLYAIQWPKGRQFEPYVEPVVVQFYGDA